MKILKNSFLVVFSCMFIVTGCTQKQANQAMNDNEAEHHLIAEHILDTEIKDLNDVVKLSDNIVIGKVLDEKKYNDSNTYKYTFLVENELKGKVESEEIDVYEAYGRLKKDKEYILFLAFWEDELYPKPVYTSVYKDFIVEINQNNLIGEEELVGQKTKDEFINAIKKSSYVKSVTINNVNNKIVIEKANDLEHLISLSDNIIQIVPKTLQEENIYVKAVEVEVLNTLKGTIKPGNLFLVLPADINLGNEYIVFLKDKENGVYGITTREGSVVSKDNKELWQKIMNKFDQ